MMDMMVHAILTGVYPSIDGDHHGNGLVPVHDLFVNPFVGSGCKSDAGIDPDSVEGFDLSLGGTLDSGQREQRLNSSSCSCQTPCYTWRHPDPQEHRQPLGTVVSPPNHRHHRSRLLVGAW